MSNTIFIQKSYLSKSAVDSEAQFHLITENYLESLMTALELSEEDFIEDMNFQQGVLTINLGTKGTWVINKQTPNRQIWWSSPISGPRRYEYKDMSWKCTRDGKDLKETLANEVNLTTGKKLVFLKDSN